MSVAVVIITKNEERNMREAILNAQKLTDEVIIIDSGSTDRTVEIAEELGAHIFFRTWDNSFSNQRNFAVQCTESDWLMHLDADERMSDELIRSIKAVLATEKKALYECARHNSAFGQDFKYGVLGPDSVKRLFPRESVQWVGEVHERPEGNVPLKQLKGHITHYTYVNFDQYVSKQNIYSTIWAKDNCGRKRTNLVKDLIFRPIFAFIKMYFFKQGFREGWMGFILSCYYANYTMSKYVKLYLENKK